jgi:hypothetical protein
VWLYACLFVHPQGPSVDEIERLLAVGGACNDFVSGGLFDRSLRWGIFAQAVESWLFVRFDLFGIGRAAWFPRSFYRQLAA